MVFSRLSLAALAVGLAVGAPFAAARAEGPYSKAQPLLAATSNVLDEKLLLPDGSPLLVTSAIVTIDPGEATAWHKHGVPVYIYILSGTVTVDYGEKGTKTFGPGTAFMEAMDNWHRGTNKGAEPVRILAVYMGSEKSRNTIARD
jgi:quercetin dioxygenase-like cupin family protein